MKGLWKGEMELTIPGGNAMEIKIMKIKLILKL